LLHNEIDSAHSEIDSAHSEIDSAHSVNRNPNNTEYVANLIYLVDSGKADKMDADENDGIKKLKKEKLFLQNNDIEDPEKKKLEPLSKEAVEYLEGFKKKKPIEMPGWKKRALKRKTKKNKIVPNCKYCYWETKYHTCEERGEPIPSDAEMKNCKSFIPINEAYLRKAAKKHWKNIDKNQENTCKQKDIL